MARILITSTGSMGDLLPYACIGRRLRERGHSVIFAVEQRFADWLVREGFPVHILAGDLIATFIEYAPELPATTNPVRSIQILLDQYLVPTLPNRVEILSTLCHESDLLISSTVQLSGRFAADLTHTQFVSIALTPATIPDPAFAPYPYHLPSRQWLRRGANRIAWLAGRLAIRRIADPPLSRWRIRFGLPVEQDYLFEGGISQQLTAVAVSPSILPPDLHWPAHVIATGFCFWDDDVWVEPADLTAFLDNTSPVVAISLGSVSPATGALFAPLYQASITAIRQLGAHALIIGAPPEALPAPSADVYTIAYAPHARVFPRCAAIIHHGGIGTASQAMRAGVPTLVVPGGVDQFISASLTIQLGVGRWQRREHYSAKTAAHHLHHLLHDSNMRQLAQELGQRIQQEDGAATLAEAIETILQSGRPA